jgi:hypothetical protein
VDAEGLISNIMAIIRRPVATGTRPPSRPASTSTAVVDGFTHEDPEWTDYMGEYAPVKLPRECSEGLRGDSRIFKRNPLCRVLRVSEKVSMCYCAGFASSYSGPRVELLTQATNGKLSRKLQ